MSKKSGKKKGVVGPSPEQIEWDIQVKEKERILMGYLSPVESSVMTFQNILVWEKPHHSAVLFFVVHILFWLISTVRVYYVIGLVGTIVVAVDMWKNHIWPEIRVPQSPSEDQEDWTPVHPRLLSVPEICEWCAQAWQYSSHFILTAVNMRSQNRPKFFVYSMAFLLTTAVLGLYISGVMLAYITVLFCLLWPCVLYHDGLSLIQQYLQPVLSNIEDRINIRRTRRVCKKTKSRSGDSPTTMATNVDADADDSDENLEGFVPPPSDVSVQLTLDKADSDSDIEEMAAGLLTMPHIPSRDPSREPSRDPSREPSVNPTPEHSDTEDMLGYSQSDMSELGSLVVGLQDLPGHDDIDTHNPHIQMSQGELSREVDEAITDPSIDHDDTIEVPPSMETEEEINFVQSHFSQFSESDDSDQQETEKVNPEEDIIRELAENMASIPDAESVEAERTPAQEMMASGMQLLSNQGQALVSHGQTLVSAIGGSNVSGLVASTMSGLSSLRDTVANVAQGRGDTAQTDTQTDMTDSVDSKQLEAEFEFLNEEDLSQAVEDEIH